MYTAKTLDKGRLCIISSLFLCINMVVASPDELHLKTPVTPPTVPIDFNQPVYVETTTTAQVSFEASFDFTSGLYKKSPDFEAHSVVDVEPHDNKMSLIIKCDWLHRTAKVTATFNDYKYPDMILEKTVDEYKIISDDPKKVCLLLTAPGNRPFVKVIVLNADIGSFVESISQAGILLNGTQIWYGFCRN